MSLLLFLCLIFSADRKCRIFHRNQTINVSYLTSSFVFYLSSFTKSDTSVCFIINALSIEAFLLFFPDGRTFNSLCNLSCGLSSFTSVCVVLPVSLVSACIRLFWMDVTLAPPSCSVGCSPGCSSSCRRRRRSVCRPSQHLPFVEPCCRGNVGVLFARMSARQ